MSAIDTRSSEGTSIPSLSSGEALTRLHITPLDPELLHVVLPTSLRPAARNISFHTIETFPEKRFGFVDLPNMEAEKLKKKLNGATLKGTKIRIETARPETRGESDVDNVKLDKHRKKKKREGTEDGKKKRKRDYDILEGVKLEDRKVKRGWTETSAETQKKPKRTKESKDKEKDTEKKQKKKRVKSKYTDDAECLLNTKVPLNALKNLAADDGSSKRRKKDRSRQATIHEFEKTTRFPSFLKAAESASGGDSAVEYVEGKGWLDASGRVVETVKEKPKHHDRPPKPASQKKASKIVETSASDDSDATSSSGSSSDEETSDGSDGEEAESVESDSALSLAATNAALSDKARPMSSSSARSLTIKIPPPITPSSSKVHPLEALYKRVKPDETVTETPVQAQPFSFFGGDNEEDEEPSSQPAMPMTPFTRQDLEWRTVRSAAPTPDTAHPSRVRNFWANGVDPDVETNVLDAPAEDTEAEDMAEERDEDVDPRANVVSNPNKSEFQEWFWENRRDLNRSWMKRRKASAKEKRHRDNKARASRVF